MSPLNFPDYQFSHLNFEVLLLKNVPKKMDTGNEIFKLKPKLVCKGCTWKKVPTYILNSRALNIGNTILWIHIYLIFVIMNIEQVHAKQIGIGNDLVIVFGHLRPAGQ